MKALLKIAISLIVATVQLFALFEAVDAPVTPADMNGGGDPFVVEDGDETYYTYTTGSGIVIRRIESTDNMTVLEEKTVYSQGNDGILWDIWAPEIHKIGGRWYIVACALFNSDNVPAGTMPFAKEYSEHTDYYRYGFVLESKTEDIFGEYEFKSVLAPDGLNNIDGTYLSHGGKLYYICSAYLEPAHQCIYIAEMENPYTLKKDESGAILSKPQYKWEKRGWWVNEGPAVLYVNDEVYIVYSASGYSSGEYCLGMLSLVGNDVMNKHSWYKNPVPVFKKQPDKLIFHPGHCSFLYRENGDTLMFYHATDNPDFSATYRKTYVSKMSFIKDYPVF